MGILERWGQIRISICIHIRDFSYLHLYLYLITNEIEHLYMYFIGIIAYLSYLFQIQSLKLCTNPEVQIYG